MKTKNNFDLVEESVKSFTKEIGQDEAVDLETEAYLETKNEQERMEAKEEKLTAGAREQTEALLMEIEHTKELTDQASEEYQKERAKAHQEKLEAEAREDTELPDGIHPDCDPDAPNQNMVGDPRQ